MENAPKSRIITLVFRNWSAIVGKFRLVGRLAGNPSKQASMLHRSMYLKGRGEQCVKKIIKVINYI